MASRDFARARVYTRATAAEASMTRKRAHKTIRLIKMGRRTQPTPLFSRLLTVVSIGGAALPSHLPPPPPPLDAAAAAIAARRNFGGGRAVGRLLSSQMLTARILLVVSEASIRRFLDNVKRGEFFGSSKSRLSTRSLAMRAIIFLFLSMSSSFALIEETKMLTAAAAAAANCQMHTKARARLL